MIPEQAFNVEQKEYLSGFFAGLQQRGTPFVGENASGQFTSSPSDSITNNLAEDSVYGIPVDELCKEEQIKHEQHGLDVWDKILDHAARDKFAQGGDVFRFKFHGLFHVIPAQDSYMLRCRIPGCVLRDYQMEGLADIAERLGGGYAHITTRGNIQIREIMPKDTVDVLMGLREVGLTSQGAGADNVRNVTASPTSGFDPNEVYDVLPLAKAMHHYILNNRELYNLPRKFNIAFDNGGAISVCADTNDIGFYAVRVSGVEGVEDGVYFRVQLCGITGHKQFASDTGFLIKPEECVPLAAAMLRVFLENGDRTNRKKARLKYLVDKWGVEKYLKAVGEKVAFELRYLPLEQCEPRMNTVKLGYIGAHTQSEEDLFYLGIAVPVGRLSPEQMRGLAAIARRYGRGDLRLTVWQNVILPHIHLKDIESVQTEILALGLDYRLNPIQSGLIACTGSQGCKFAATDTKGHALQLGKVLSERVQLEEPVNIHLTGCPNSCAQHYIGDIGLQGVKVKANGESVEGYHVVLGGGVDDEQFIARDFYQGVPYFEIPTLLERVLLVYKKQRLQGESFASFSRRISIEEFKNLIEENVAA